MTKYRLCILAKQFCKSRSVEKKAAILQEKKIVYVAFFRKLKPWTK